jgi:hypothetical protein
MTRKLTLSKRGIPCLWEKGGGCCNTGEATLIAAPDGAPKRAIYVRRSGALANEEHALIPVSVGDLVVEAEHHREDFTIKISQITSIHEHAELSPLHVFDMGEWDTEPLPQFASLIEAAQDKATCYHCREPFYIAT